MQESIEIKISEDNLSYHSDFTDSETIYWLEAVKAVVLKKAFKRSDEEKCQTDGIITTTVVKNKVGKYGCS